MLRISGTPVETMKFPGGEMHVRLTNAQLKFKFPATLRADLRTSDDVMAMLLTVDAIKRTDPDKDINLLCPYLPYARQDRVCNPGEAISVEVMSHLINSCAFKSVTLWDCHSHVGIEAIERCENMGADLFLKGIPYDKDTMFIAPDAGAADRVRNIGATCNASVLYATKHRDSASGALSRPTIDWGTEFDGSQPLLIVDDICDGGRTFIQLLDKIRETTSTPVSLYVTHGIFSNGLEELSQWFTKIYCANIFNKELLKQYPETLFDVGY